MFYCLVQSFQIRCNHLHIPCDASDASDRVTGKEEVFTVQPHITMARVSAISNRVY